MKKTYSILGVIAIAVLVAFKLLPNVTFEESVFPLIENSVISGYDDVVDGGESVINFVVNESSVNFDCTLGQDTTKAAWCGLIWNFDPDSSMNFRNWTSMDSLVFDVEAHGTREVLLKLWTYDPNLTDIHQPRTFRLLMKELPLQDGRQRLSVPVSHLYTPDFWNKDNNVEPSNNRHQESIARLEIAPGWNQARGKTFSVKFYEVKAVGISKIVLAVVISIFLVLTIIAVGLRHQVHNDVEKD